MTTDLAALLTSSQRATLMRLADCAFPSSGDLPSASEADPSGRYTDRAINTIDRLFPDLVRVLDDAEGREPAAELARLERDDRDGLGALLTIVAGGYYTNRKVWKRIGYPGQKAVPIVPGEVEHYLRGDLLGPVRRRAAFYRPTP